MRDAHCALLTGSALQALDGFRAAIGAATALGGAVAVHCDGRAGAALVLLTAALLRDSHFPSAAAAAAWLRLLRPEPAAAAAAAAAARALAHHGGGGVVLPAIPAVLPSVADLTTTAAASAGDAGEADDVAAVSAAAASATFRRRTAASFCGRPSSPVKSVSPAREGRRLSDPCAPAADGGDGERLVWRRTPSGSRARLCSAYGDGGDGERKPFAASSPELLPFLAAAAAGR
jgi:hypothetical protein